MIYDPKYVCGDIVASLWAKPATFEELVKRFDYGTNGLLQMAVQSTLVSLRKKGYLHKTKSGVYKVTPDGYSYIESKGYVE